MIKLFFTTLLIWGITGFSMAQENNHENSPTVQEHKKHFVGLFAGHTIIVQSKYQMPTLGLEYIYEFNERIGIGLVAEVEIGSHIIQENENGIIVEVERSGAFLLLPTTFITVYKGLIFTAGLGIEFARDENLFLSKVGFEYKFRMHTPNWTLLPSVSWDRTNLFDGIVYGITAGYSF